MQKKKLLEQDDCAPDSLSYFTYEMKKRYDLGMEDFKKFGEFSCPDEMTMRWIFEDFILEIYADSPWYVLYQFQNLDLLD